MSKPRLRPQLGGWSVLDSSGYLQEWYRDFNEACKSAKTIDYKVAEEARQALLPYQTKEDHGRPA